jgi:hypothetical protein
VTELSEKTLFPQTKSWYVVSKHGQTVRRTLISWRRYMGDNIPGKFREQLNVSLAIRTAFETYTDLLRLVQFAGGFPLYKTLTREALDKGFEGFVTA